jgi:hypothetical protein
MTLNENDPKDVARAIGQLLDGDAVFLQAACRLTTRQICRLTYYAFGAFMVHYDTDHPPLPEEDPAYATATGTAAPTSPNKPVH